MKGNTLSNPQIAIHPDAWFEVVVAGRESTPEISLGALLGSVGYTADGHRVVEVRNAVPMPTVFDGLRHVPDRVAWHDLERRYPAGPDGQQRVVGWFYADAALRTRRPRVYLEIAHSTLASETGVLLLVDPANEEGAFFVSADGGFARVEATRMKSDVARIAVGVAGWPIAPWNSDFPGSPSWLTKPVAAAPSWLEDPVPAGVADTLSPEERPRPSTTGAGNAPEPARVMPYMGTLERDTPPLAQNESAPPSHEVPAAPAHKVEAPLPREAVTPLPVQDTTPEVAVRAKLPTITVLPPQVEQAAERSRRDIAVLGLSAILALVVLVMSNPSLFQAEREARNVSPTALVAEALPASPTALATRVSEVLGMEGPAEAIAPATPTEVPTEVPTEAPTPVPPPADTPTFIPEPTPEPPPTEAPIEAEPPTAPPPAADPPTAATRRATATPARSAPRATATRRPPAPTATPVTAAATVPVPVNTPVPPPPPPATPVPPTSVATTPPVPTNTPVPPPPPPATNTPVPVPPTNTPVPPPPPPTNTPAPPPPTTPPPPPDTPVPQPTSPPPTTTPPPPDPTDTPVPVEPTATNTPRPVVDATNTPRPVVDPTDTPTPRTGGSPNVTP